MADLEGDEGLQAPTDDELFGKTRPAFGGEDPVTGAQEELYDLLGGSGEPDEGAGETDEAGESGEDDPALGPDQGEEVPEEAPEGEDREVEPEEADEDFEPEGDEPEELADDEAAEAEDGDSDLDLDQTITVTVDGEEQEVTLEEARNGYMRTAAFTRKTQELADQRRQVQEVAQEIRAEREQYADALENVEQVLDALQPEKPDPSLRENNPREYARQMEAYEKQQERIEAVQEEREAAQEQNQQEAMRARQRRLAEERELLEAAIPQLADPEKGPEIRNEMVETAQDEYGFQPEELAQVDDHRALRLLYDAMRYRELEEQGQNVTKKDRGTSKKGSKSKTLKPGSSKATKESQAKSRKSRQSEEARERLAKRGRVEDATAVLESMLSEE